MKFLKSLGLKSDSVGWTEINLESPIAKEQMEKINNYVQSNNKKIRIGYEWRKLFAESKWYIIEPVFLNQEIRFFKTDKASGDSYCAGIYSYKVPRAENIIEWDFMKATAALVSKQFMECSKKYGLTGADFVWAYDGGRYQGPEYYRMVNMSYCDKVFECNSDSVEPIMKKHKKETEKAFGPNWEWLIHYDIGSDFPYFNVLPVPAGKEPDSDFMRCGEYILAGRHAISCLMKEGVLTEKNIFPCEFVEEAPLIYEETTERYFDEFLSAIEMQEIQMEHEEFKKNPRPKRIVKKKEVLAALKIGKKSNPDCFSKPLKKNSREELENLGLETMVDYFKISDGIYLSEEFRMCSFEEMQEEQQCYEFFRRQEDALELPEGKVIAKATDGDFVLLIGEKVKRFSHEDWAILDEWDNVETFVFEEMELG